MLAIRLQRTGRSGHAQFRVIVQDSRFSPTRGRVVAYLGSYNPHTKTANLDSQKASKYLQNGAQPSDRVARLLKKEGVKLPTWATLDEPRKRQVRNPEKRRSTRPAGTEAPAPAAETAEKPVAETEDQTAAEAPTEPSPEAPASEEPAASEPEAEDTALNEAAPEAPTEDEKPADETAKSS